MPSIHCRWIFKQHTFLQALRQIYSKIFQFIFQIMWKEWKKNHSSKSKKTNERTFFYWILITILKAMIPWKISYISTDLCLFECNHLRLLKHSSVAVNFLYIDFCSTNNPTWIVFTFFESWNLLTYIQSVIVVWWCSGYHSCPTLLN